MSILPREPEGFDSLRRFMALAAIGAVSWVVSARGAMRWCGCFKSSSSTEDLEDESVDLDLKDENVDPRPMLRTFGFMELSYATADFCRNHKIGHDGSCPFYEGYLYGIGPVAVRRLNMDKLPRYDEYLSEVLALNKTNHPNVVNLVGCCAEKKECLIVYDHVPSGSLKDHLEDEKINMDWKIRLKIAYGVAKALEHLQLSCDPPIVHRNFNSANLLLDGKFNPKLADVAIPTFVPINEDPDARNIRLNAVFGYPAPETIETGRLTVESNIFSFRVMVLELFTAWKSTCKKSPIVWFRKRENSINSLRTVDPKLADSVPTIMLKYFIALAAECMHEDYTARRPIQDIVLAMSFLDSIADKHCQSATALPDCTRAVTPAEKRDTSDKSSAPV